MIRVVAVQISSPSVAVHLERARCAVVTLPVFDASLTAANSIFVHTLFLIQWEAVFRVLVGPLCFFVEPIDVIYLSLSWLWVERSERLVTCQRLVENTMARLWRVSFLRESWPTCVVRHLHLFDHLNKWFLFDSKPVAELLLRDLVLRDQNGTRLNHSCRWWYYWALI